ncbi:MAG: putative metal-binding motif-containing protein [Sandaracinus sp.]
MSSFATLAATLLSGCGGDTSTSVDDDAALDAAFDASADAARLDGASEDSARTGGDGGCPDADGDGARAASCGGTDCDDADPEAYPGHMEVCDAAHRDEDCDPSTVGFRDQDSDGYLDAACCNGALCGDDCNDTRPTAHPGGTEACDSFDNDCDAAIDEGVLETFYPDTDGDGFGNAAGTTITGCTIPPGYSSLADATDCDDTVRGVNPSAMEICDAAMVDENCDGVHNPVALCACNAGDPPRACTLPGICASGREMCSDGAWGMCTVMPRGESCNGLDDDCDNAVDETLTIVCYADTDNDTYPDGLGAAQSTPCPDASRTSVGGCPSGTTNRVPDASNVDCGPSDSTVHPLAVEICNDVDDDCQGGIDEGVSSQCYADVDNDTYSPAGATPSRRCQDPSRGAVGFCPTGFTNLAPGGQPDCDDAAFGTHPGALELCDGASADEDCDGMHNEGCNCTVTGSPVSCQTALGAQGRCASGTTTCVAGMWSACSVQAVTETCNGMDDDCNGAVDNGVLVACCVDADNDGSVVTLTPAMSACSCPSGYRVCPAAGTPVDCNDSSAAIHPGATELCNRVDDDCSTGGGVVSAEDADLDNYASPSAACSGGFPRTDCNDAAAAVHPGAAEVCNGVDDNCAAGIDEGVTTRYYRDADVDNYGAAATFVDGCTPPGGYVTNASDCDDTRSDVRPGAPELCDGVWNNCTNGSGARSAEDADGDHHAPTSGGAGLCSGGYPRDDCADLTATAYLGATAYRDAPYCTNGRTPISCTSGLGTSLQCGTTCLPPGSAVYATFDYNCMNGEEPEPVATSCTGGCLVMGSTCRDGPTTSGVICGAMTTYTDCSCSVTCSLVGHPTRPQACR